MGLYYFDSSALAKRYINEVGTNWVLGLTDPGANNMLFIARITAVEVVAAIMRAARKGSISSADAAIAVNNFRHDYQTQYRAMEITAGVVAQAMTMAERHGLRGYDAVQLSGALETQKFNVAANSPVLTMISGDKDLNTAATAEGLSVDDPNNHP